jgi:hypothetical protein
LGDGNWRRWTKGKAGMRRIDREFSRAALRVDADVPGLAEIHLADPGDRR